MPADEWNVLRRSQISTQKWLMRLLLCLIILQTLVFGLWTSQCVACDPFISVASLALFYYLTLVATLLAFAVTLCIFCYIEAAINFFTDHKRILGVIALLPTLLFALCVLYMVWYSFCTDDLNLSSKAYGCLLTTGLLCLPCIANGYILRAVLKEQKEAASEISSFHSSAVVAAQE